MTYFIILLCENYFGARVVVVYSLHIKFHQKVFFWILNIKIKTKQQSRKPGKIGYGFIKSRL